MTPLQRQSSRCLFSTALKERIQRAKQESWEDDSTKVAITTTHAALSTGTALGLSSPNYAPPPKPLEHILVGTGILTTHKHHINELVEILWTEMDVVQKLISIL